MLKPMLVAVEEVELSALVGSWYRCAAWLLHVVERFCFPLKASLKVRDSVDENFNCWCYKGGFVSYCSDYVGNMEMALRRESLGKEWTRI